MPVPWKYQYVDASFGAGVSGSGNAGGGRFVLGGCCLLLVEGCGDNGREPGREDGREIALRLTLRLRSSSLFIGGPSNPAGTARLDGFESAGFIEDAAVCFHYLHKAT